jgi:hypothetical protein
MFDRREVGNNHVIAGGLSTKGEWRQCTGIRLLHSPRPRQLHRRENCAVIILGLLLLLVGWLTGVSLLYTVGSIVLIVGIVFFILGNVDRPVGGRKVWF